MGRWKRRYPADQSPSIFLSQSPLLQPTPCSAGSVICGMQLKGKHLIFLDPDLQPSWGWVHLIPDEAGMHSGVVSGTWISEA